MAIPRAQRASLTHADATLPRRIFFTVLGIGAIAVATILIVLVWLSRETDALARQSALYRVETQVDTLSEQLNILTMDYAFWQAAYDWYLAADHEALLFNLGSGATDSTTFDMIYLLNDQGQGTHAYVSDAEVSDLSVYPTSVGNMFFAALTATPPEVHATADGFALIDGRVAALSAAYILPDTLETQSDVSYPVMIGGRWLDINQLARDNFVQGATYVSGTTTPTGLDHYKLYDIQGNRLGMITWHTPHPGADLRWKMAPTIALLSLLILVGSWTAGRGTALQTRAYLRERTNARTDGLTGLLNRHGLEEAVKLIPDPIDDGNIAAIFVDLNKFKHLNDTYGHDAGDRALRFLAARLASILRPNDILARLGGDEFVCILVANDAQSKADVIAKRLAAELQKARWKQDIPTKLSASIGVAVSTKGMDWHDLVRAADQAMYDAKRQGEAPNKADRLSVASA